VYAEDPRNNFLPDIGKLEVYRRPQGHGIRLDDGFEQGMQIPIYYDPMIGKLIAHAGDREAAIAKMLRAIREFEIVGFETTLGFCEFVLEHEAFVSGNFDTKFVEKHFRPELLQKPLTAEEIEVVGLVAVTLFSSSIAAPTVAAGNPASQKQSNWKRHRLYT
jgi:acetyl-CoA carboxylase, biotin carboxylase subunit